jgi:hypothetical protein
MYTKPIIILKKDSYSKLIFFFQEKKRIFRYDSAVLAVFRARARARLFVPAAPRFSFPVSHSVYLQNIFSF